MSQASPQLEKLLFCLYDKAMLDSALEFGVLTPDEIELVLVERQLIERQIKVEKEKLLRVAPYFMGRVFHYRKTIHDHDCLFVIAFSAAGEIELEYSVEKRDGEKAQAIEHLD